MQDDHSFRCMLNIKNPDFKQEERRTFGQGQERAFKTDFAYQPILR